ncbi:Transcription initiation factor TFIID subunit 11b [Spatholobus suberectus]|nr:Transcription initiation factor TFIID subunit 11b [Spatholobus suberectus]
MLSPQGFIAESHFAGSEERCKSSGCSSEEEAREGDVASEAGPDPVREEDPQAEAQGVRMKQSKDPFVAAFEESPPESPAETEAETQNPSSSSSSVVPLVPQPPQTQKVKNEDEEDADESRYESSRRAAFRKANMKRLLASITGTQKISVPMTIVVSSIAKMFVREVVETARIVMEERKESGPIRPCHLREAYRRLKLEGKVFKRSASRLFR